MQPEEILEFLPPDFLWADRIHCFDVLDSTNTRLKELSLQGAPHGTVLIADRQSAGRGRRGRSFHSPEGMGIYLSVLLRPNCPPEQLMHLTCATAVAMCHGLETGAGVQCGIKWTNDLVVNRRKLAGILTELLLGADGAVTGAIVGIGVNCLQQPTDFPEELREMATSVACLTASPPCRARIAAAMIASLHTMNDTLFSRRETMLAQYRTHCVTLGQSVSLLRGDSVRHGRALDIDECGALIVEFPDGHREHIDSGEVSVRGMYGYL